MKPPQAIDQGPSTAFLEAKTAMRAFEKWLARGRANGTQLQDWLEAEAEVRQLWEAARHLAEVEERLTRQIAEHRRAERRLIAEHAVSRILAVSNTLSDAAPKIIQAICESLGWDVGEVWVLDRNANVLRCVEVCHTPTVEASAFEQDTRHRTFSLGMGMPGHVWASQSLTWIPDLAADGNFLRAPSAAQVGLHGAVGFPIRSGSEFFGVIAFLSREVRRPDEELVEMMTSIGGHISQFIERRQAEEELHKQEADRRIARQIQQGLLPKATPTFAGFKISGRLSTANEVGGDCFDFFPSLVDGKEYLDVLVADATGHGIAAALLMAETRAYVRALALTCADVGTLLTLTNRRLADEFVSGHFVTLFLMRLDPHTRSLLYVGAGHWPAYVLDGQGHTRATLASMGIPIGIDSTSEYSTGPTTPLEPGDLVFLFTDGIVEAASPDRRRFGLERTLSIVRSHQQGSPDEILEALFAAINELSEGHLQDDLTAVVIQVKNVAAGSEGLRQE